MIGSLFVVASVLLVGSGIHLRRKRSVRSHALDPVDTIEWFVQRCRDHRPPDAGAHVLARPGRHRV